MRSRPTGALLLWLDGISCHVEAERGSSTAGPASQTTSISTWWETTSSAPRRPRRPPSALSPRPGSARAATPRLDLQLGRGDRRVLVAGGGGVGLSVGPVADRDRPLGSWSWWARKHLLSPIVHRGRHAP